MKYIEQHDPVSGWSFEIPEIPADGLTTMEEVIVTYAEYFHAAVASALYNAVELDLDRVPVLAVQGLDEILELRKEDYSSQLETTLEYFEKREEYELCSALVKLREKL